MNSNDQKIYKGIYDKVDDEVFVYVNSEPLDVVDEDLIEYKPVGTFELLRGGRDFGWGFHGTGPLKLAYAIIMDYTGDKNIALKYYKEFEYSVISNITEMEWKMCGLYVRGCLDVYKKHRS